MIASDGLPARIVMPGGSTGECGPALSDYYAARFTSNAALRIAVSKDGPYALVSWESGASGGMDLFRRLGPSWCRIAVGHRAPGGRFPPTAWFTPDDIAGFDELDALRARRLFNGPSITQTLDFRSHRPIAASSAQSQKRRPASAAVTGSHVP